MAAPYKSEATQLAVGVESTQGSPVPPSRHFGKVESDTELPDPEVDWAEERVIGGSRELHDKVEGQHVYDGGTIPVIVYDGAPIAYLMGEDQVQVDTNINGNSETGTDTHVLLPGMGSPPVTQTIEAAYYGRDGGSAFVRTFEGCAADSGEISIDNEDQLQVELDYIAMGVSTGTGVSDVGSVPNRPTWHYADTVSNLSMFGQAFARVTDFSLSVENNLTAEHYIESTDLRDPSEITYGMVDYELTATIKISDDSIYQELINPSPTGFTAELEFMKPSTGENLRITCDGCNFSDAPHDIPEEGAIEVEVTIIPESVTIKVEDTQSGGTAYV